MTAPVPRPFQADAMRRVGDEFRKGHRGVCLVSGTGSGKTLTASMMVARWVAQTMVDARTKTRRHKRIAWGAHRSELLDQAEETLARFGVRCGKNGAGQDALVQLFTYQEAVARGQAPEADVFVADECHHLGDEKLWEGIGRGYLDAGRLVLGLTATPARSDGRALPIFNALVVAAQIRELIGMGWLVPLRWRGPSAMLASQKIAQDPWDAYDAEARGRCAVVFAPNLKAAQAYVDGFEAHGVSVRLVDGKMKDAARDAALRAHRAGEVDVLVNVNLLLEGWDNPRCDCVIMARACQAPVLWIQAVGRGMRPHCGCGKLARGEACSCLKKDCLLLDLRGIAHELGRPDAEATYSLDGAGIVLAQDAAIPGERLCKVCKVPLPPKEVVCPECGKDNGPKVPKSVNAPLTDWEVKWEAAKTVVNASKLVLSLAGILHKADEAARAGKPWKPSAPGVRFAHMFGRRPYPNEMAAARHLVNTADRFEPPQRSLGT